MRRCSQAYPRHPGCLSSWPSLRGTCTRCTPGSPLALAVLCTFPKTSWLMANNWSLGPGDPCVMLVLAGGGPGPSQPCRNWPWRAVRGGMSPQQQLQAVYSHLLHLERELTEMFIYTGGQALRRNRFRRSGSGRPGDRPPGGGSDAIMPGSLEHTHQMLLPRPVRKGTRSQMSASCFPATPVFAQKAHERVVVVGGWRSRGQHSSLPPRPSCVLPPKH